jgi:hypothetical protein
MSDKFEFYDVLGILVPGSILLALIALSFPEITSAFASIGFPDAFAVICQAGDQCRLPTAPHDASRRRTFPQKEDCDLNSKAGLSSKEGEFATSTTT